MTFSRSYCRRLAPAGIAVIALVTLLWLIPASYAARADLSPTTQQFYGAVYNNDVPVPAGYTITALVGATVVGRTITDSQGRYGYDPVFEVSSVAGKLVNFSVNDHPAIQHAIFQGGLATKLNLTAYGASGQMPSTSCRTCGSTGCSVACGISPTILPDGKVGVPYSTDLTASGGTPPYTWSVVAGTLPAGLRLDSVFGVIKGVPTDPFYYTFTVRVDDSKLNYLTMETAINVTGSSAAQKQTSQGGLTVGVNSNFLGMVESMSISNNAMIGTIELTSEDRRVRLMIKDGTALNLQGRNVITAAGESNPHEADDGSICVRSYSFGPAGATFIPAATMTLQYETPLPEGLTEPGLYIAYWDGVAWNRLESTVNLAAKEVIAPVQHFTVFAIRWLPAVAAPQKAADDRADAAAPPADTPAAAAAFTFSDLSIKPDIVSPGEKTTVSVRVANNGGSPVQGTVILKVNGQETSRKDVALDKDKSQQVTFSLSQHTPGTYNVTIGGLSAGLHVSPESGFDLGSDWSSLAMGAVIILAGLIIAIVLVRDILIRRRQ